MLRRRRKTAGVPHAGPYPHGWEVPARFNFTRDVVELGQEVEVDIRGRRGAATVVQPPFVDRSPR